MSSHPSSDFYWADWENEPTLKLASLAAQAIWMRICCRCHHSPRRGHFLLEDGGTPTLADCATLFGKPADEIAPLIEELVARKVCDRDEFGVIINRRMLKEEARKHRARAQGKKGGNPLLVAKSELAKAELREAARRDSAAERARKYRASKRAPESQCESETRHAPVTPCVTQKSVTRVTRHVTGCVTVEDKNSVSAEACEPRHGVNPEDNPSFLLPPSKNSLSEKSSSVPHRAPPATLTGGGARVASRTSTGEDARGRQERLKVALAALPARRADA